MAAATWLPDGGDSVVGTVLGVDPNRLAAVGYPVAGGPSLSEVARTIQAASVPPIVITAPRLRVHVRAVGLAGDKRPYLEVNLRTPERPFYAVDATSINDGNRTYSLSLSCATGCTLVGLTWNRSIDAQDAQSGTITLTGIDVSRGDSWSPLDIGLNVAASWRAAVPTGQATDQVQVTTAGVADRFTNRNGGYGGIVYASSPSPMPADRHPQIHRRGATTGFRHERADLGSHHHRLDLYPGLLRHRALHSGASGRARQRRDHGRALPAQRTPRLPHRGPVAGVARDRRPGGRGGPPRRGRDPRREHAQRTDTTGPARPSGSGVGPAAARRLRDRRAPFSPSGGPLSRSARAVAGAPTRSPPCARSG